MDTMRSDTRVNVAVIVGSTRPNRFAEAPARWIIERLQEHPGVEARLLDLRDHRLPYFEETVIPAARGDDQFEHEAVRRWSEAIDGSDAFVIVSPEYNHGYPGVLKNAIDYLYREWNRKPVAFVGYGGVGGARVIQQLRQVAVELQMVPVRTAVHLPLPPLIAHINGGDVREELAKENARADQMLDDLLWWAQALKHQREASLAAVR
jgi:NAD(P)H-dependent FMN reductase